MTDTEISEAVAKKLRGIYPCTLIPCVRMIPNYCYSIEAAWEIVDWFYNNDWGFRINRAAGPNKTYSVDVWYVEPGQGGGGIPYGKNIKAVDDKHPARAICLAFLQI